MATQRFPLVRLIVDTVIPAACSTFLGYLFVQSLVFERFHPAFQFLAGSIILALVINLLLRTTVRTTLIGLGLLFILKVFLAGSDSVHGILHDVFSVGAVGVSGFLYYFLSRRSQVDHFALPPFLLAGIYGTVYIIASEILFFLLRVLTTDGSGGTIFSLAEISAFYGVLIGFAVGAGFSMVHTMHKRVP